MKKTIFAAFAAIMLFSSCAKEFNAVYKSRDNDYRYEFAKELFVAGKYSQAGVLLKDLLAVTKGTDNGEECLFMCGMADYMYGDYESAAMAFQKYSKTYPRGFYADEATFYVGKSLYMSTPEPRLDQTETLAAMKSLQEYLDVFPDAKHKEEAQECLIKLQDKLIEKELMNAQLYFNLGSYFGNCTNGGSNYEACIITAQNALKDYPYTNRRENFSLLVMKSKYALAQQSVEAKRAERYQDAEEECHGFINEYPESQYVELANKYIENCRKYIKD